MDQETLTIEDVILQRDAARKDAERLADALDTYQKRSRCYSPDAEAQAKEALALHEELTKKQ